MVLGYVCVKFHTSYTSLGYNFPLIKLLQVRKFKWGEGLLGPFSRRGVMVNDSKGTQKR